MRLRIQEGVSEARGFNLKDKRVVIDEEKEALRFAERERETWCMMPSMLDLVSEPGASVS
jgi:hypothetical protein